MKAAKETQTNSGTTNKKNSKKKRVSLLYRTATTFYPCCGQALGEFKGSWSYRTYPTAKVLQKYETDKFFAVFLH